MNSITLSKQELRYFNYSIQTNYLRNEEKSITSNSNIMYFNFLELIKFLSKHKHKVKNLPCKSDNEKFL